VEILPHKNYKELLDLMPQVKSALQEWLFVDLRLTKDCDKNFTVAAAADLIHSLFKDKEGKIYIGNDHSMIMLVRTGKNYPPAELTNNIKRHLPEGSCEVRVSEPTPEGLNKLEVFITYKKTEATQSLVDIRKSRKENVILVADDDMYQREIIKKGLAKIGAVVEVESGDGVAAAYSRCNPDIVFLDIHMPGRSGREIVYELAELDPDSFVVMISADGSRENVADTWQKGAKEFLTKPFTKEKLLECVKKCPTIS
jgi:two-component system chemotaxis response regulator CheY